MTSEQAAITVAVSAVNMIRRLTEAELALHAVAGIASRLTHSGHWTGSDASVFVAGVHVAGDRLTRLREAVLETFAEVIADVYEDQDPTSAGVASSRGIRGEAPAGVGPLTERRGLVRPVDGPA